MATTDLLLGLGSAAPSVVPIGSNTQVLTVTAGVIGWAAAAGGATSPYLITGTPPANANQGALELGGGVFGGGGGTFAGLAAGTGLAINLASGSTADLINAQLAGVSKLQLTGAGALTLTHGSGYTTGLVVKSGTQTLRISADNGSNGAIVDLSNNTGADLFVGAARTLIFTDVNGTAAARVFNSNVDMTRPFHPATDALAYQTACALFAGTGAPSNSNGNNGDVYFRSDGGASTTIYQKRSGSWTGIV